MPIAIEPAAVCIACIAEPQKRLTVGAADAAGQARQHADDATHVHTLLALGERAAHGDVLDRVGVDAAALHQRLAPPAAELVGAGAGQLAAVGGETASGRTRR